MSLGTLNGIESTVGLQLDIISSLLFNYISQILEKAVKPWLEKGDDFALEDDGDSSHSPKNNGNIVQK